MTMTYVLLMATFLSCSNDIELPGFYLKNCQVRSVPQEMYPYVEGDTAQQKTALERCNEQLRQATNLGRNQVIALSCHDRADDN